MDNVPITIRFAPAKYSRIKDIAKSKKMSIAGLVRQTMDSTYKLKNEKEDNSKAFAELEAFAKKMAKKYSFNLHGKTMAEQLIEMRYEQ